MTSRALDLMFAAVVGLAVGACEKSETTSSSERAEKASESETDPSSEKGPTIVHLEGPEPEGGTIVAEADGIEVTLEAYDQFLRRTRLFAPAQGDEVPEIPAERKADPRLQSRTVRSLLENRVIERVADEREVEVENEEIGSFVRNHEKLGRWASALDADAGAGGALPEGLSASDLRAVARARVLRKKLREVLAEAPQGDGLWRLYERRHTNIRVAYVALENAPTPDEIDAFVAEHAGDGSSRIREYFEEHRDEYRQPKLVEVSVVQPVPGENVEREALEEAARRLEEGESAEEIADDLGLEFEERAYLRRLENREAFGAKKGATGYQLEGPRGAYAWRVEGWREGAAAELDRGLRREIAAEMLRREVVPSVRERLESVLQAMRSAAGAASWPVDSSELAPVRETLSGREATLETTKPFARNERGAVPGLGLAEPVMEAAFDLSPDRPVAEEPILNRERAVALMLIDRDEASRSTFEERRESFRSDVLARRRKEAVRNYLEEWFSEHEPSIDLEPVQIKYGRLEK